MAEPKKFHVVGMPRLMQETGDSEKDTMSQKAITDAINNRVAAPTEADEGKFLKVVNGAWVAVELPVYKGEVVE